MVNKLLDALQLFKENRLGSVVALDCLAEAKRLRQEFRLRTERGHGNKGSDLVVADLELSRFTIKRCFCYLPKEWLKLVELVQKDHHQVEERIGREATDEIYQKLAERGLSFAMSPEHMVEAFGLRP